MGIKIWEHFKALRNPLERKRELVGRMGFILQQEPRDDGLVNISNER
jgi:hypothetical protein